MQTQELLRSRPGGRLNCLHLTITQTFTPVVREWSAFDLWDKGHLVAFSVGEMKEPVASYDRTGKRLFESFLHFDNAVRTYVQDAVATSLDTVLVAASVLSGDGASADIIAEIGSGVFAALSEPHLFIP